jgi:hypothetical protein
MMADLKTANFYYLTDLVPNEWNDWFFQEVGDTHDFCWGDNNHSLVTVERFYDTVKEILENQDDCDLADGEIECFLDDIKVLFNNEQTYIDLEN